MLKPIIRAAARAAAYSIFSGTLKRLNSSRHSKKMLPLNDTLIRILVLPVIPILFAYLELGGNWFAFRMIERQTIWSVTGTIIFSVLYSFVAAYVAKKFAINLALLMVNYGFGFAIISVLLKLDWGKIPEFTNENLIATPSLWGVLLIALIGFLFSAYIVISSPHQP